MGNRETLKRIDMSWSWGCDCWMKSQDVSPTCLLKCLEFPRALSLPLIWWMFLSVSWLETQKANPPYFRMIPRSKGVWRTELQFLNDFGRFWGTELITVNCNLIGVTLKSGLQNQKQSTGYERLRLTRVLYKKKGIGISFDYRKLWVSSVIWLY